MIIGIQLEDDFGFCLLYGNNLYSMNKLTVVSINHMIDCNVVKDFIEFVFMMLEVAAHLSDLLNSQTYEYSRSNEIGILLTSNLYKILSDIRDPIT